MNIGIIMLSILACILTFQTVRAYSSLKGLDPLLPAYLVPQQVGRTRSIQSKTGDASMSTEYTRRKAISSLVTCDPSSAKKIRETRTSTGSTSGYLESFMLSMFCKPPTFNVLRDAKYILDGGNAFITDYDILVDGNIDTILMFDGNL